MIAEHRGPGVHHGFDNENDDYEMPMDLDHRAQALSRLARGIILLPDGTGFATGSGFGGSHLPADSNDKDADMFDNDEEDRDLEAQVPKGSTPSGSSSENESPTDERSRREETPAPEKSEDPPATLPSRTHTESATKETSDTKAHTTDEKSG